MIMWTLTISGQQMALLKMFSERISGRRHNTPAREREIGIHPNTIPGCRTLVREGLLEHRIVKAGSGYHDPDRSGYFITDRGRFILSMVERDIDKFLSADGQLASKRRKPGRLKAAS